MEVGTGLGVGETGEHSKVLPLGGSQSACKGRQSNQMITKMDVKSQWEQGPSKRGHRTLKTVLGFDPFGRLPGGGDI